MISEEESNDKLREYKRLLEGIQSIFTEFENSNKVQEKEKDGKRKSFKKKDTKVYQLLNNHEFYKFLLISNYYRGKLTLLDEKQAIDENDSYQKIMDLFLEENDTIPNAKLSGNDVNRYLLTQLYTAFSLLCRKVYLDGVNIDPSSNEEKDRNFLKHLNAIKFDKNSKLTNEMLEYFNHNILRIEDIYQSDENKNNLNESINKKDKMAQYKKKSFMIEAKEIKKKGFDKNNINNMNNFNQFDFDFNNGNVILNNDNKDEAVQQVDSISYEKNFRNIDFDNEEYKREKSINMRKILEISEEKLKNISIGEFQELISEVYENGTVNKELEDKITGGKGNLFKDETHHKHRDSKSSFSIKMINDSDILLNSGEKLDNDEEVIDDRELDFEQEEIKKDHNKNSFFEKGDDFSKDFFQNNSEIEDEKNNNKQIETISHNENLSLSQINKSKSRFSN